MHRALPLIQHLENTDQNEDCQWLLLLEAELWSCLFSMRIETDITDEMAV